MRENVELRAISRAQLQGGWLAAVGMLFVGFLIFSASGITLIGPLVLAGPLILGATGYFLKKARGEPVELDNLFDGFKLFGKSLSLYLLEFIFITLWSCLLVIPGIVKFFSYAMSFFILRDNPEMGAAEAITRSRKMMVGYKGKLFRLGLSFIGWALLCCLSFGIGFFWLVPYVYLSLAHFYEDLKQNQPVNVFPPAG